MTVNNRLRRYSNITIGSIYNISPEIYDIIPAVREAVEQCKDSIEECGGIITKIDSKFCFNKVRNTNTGTSLAVAMYDLDKDEFGQLLGLLKTKEDYLWGSFHTHPCPAWPSNIDMTKLFRNFSNNIIYSRSANELILYRFDGASADNQTYTWKAFDLMPILD